MSDLNAPQDGGAPQQDVSVQVPDQQQPYTQQAMSVKPEEQSARNMAIAGMVLGIVALVFFWFVIISLPCGIVGIVLSIIAIKRGQRGMAVAGLVCSILSIAIWVILLLVGILFASAAISSLFMF